jgi:hypothetical protein
MKKNHIKQFLSRLKRIKAWQLFLLLIPMLFLSATFLRFDHLGMIERLDAVFQADENGSDEEIASALSELQRYVSTHIVFNVVERNGMEEIIFGTGPFYLENQYIRKATEEIERAKETFEGDENPLGNIFQQAAAICDPPFHEQRWSWNRYMECFLAEIERHPAAEEIEDYRRAIVPSTSLYRHNFASPIWYPNLAGFSILICLILLVVIITKALMALFLRIALLFIKNK